MALISEQFNEALVKQIGEEVASAYIYLSMATWLKENSFDNLSHWFQVQWQEELSHAQKFIDFIVEVGGTVKLPAIPAPKSDWTSVEEIVKTAYKHEQYITQKIYELVKLSEELKEYASGEILRWFVSEQVEEEASTGDLVDKHAAFKNDMIFDQYISRDESSE